MTNAYVLMTAMPPTIGHRNLIQFASFLANHVTVLVCTQPGEPLCEERFWALYETFINNPRVTIRRIHKTLPQEPEGQEGFWDMWVGFLHTFGFRDGDMIVASEAYGKKLAEEAKGKFMPYDLNRSIVYTKATKVREDYRYHWQDILPEFRTVLKKTVTIFGAESVGKTTTAERLADLLPNTKWYFEWARPYLEVVGAEVTPEKMFDIWKGQEALHLLAGNDADAEFSIFDTDLYSTIGYWEMYQPGQVPSDLYDAASLFQSDLYIILSSDIPFAPDQLRYGGDKRESTDQYWIDLCEREKLPYIYIRDGASFADIRVKSVKEAILNRWPGDELSYQRIGHEYDNNV